MMEKSSFCHNCPGSDGHRGQRMRQRSDGVTKMFRCYRQLGHKDNQEYFVFNAHRN